MKFARGGLQLLGSRSLQALLALIASVAVARSTGPSGLGEYGVLLASVVLFQGLTSVGLEDFVLARGPASGCDSLQARTFYSAALRTRLLTATLLLVGGTLTMLGWLPVFEGSKTALAAAWIYAGLNSIATLGSAVQSARVAPGVSAALDAGWALGVTASYVVLAADGKLTVTSALLLTAGWQAVAVVGYIWNLRNLIRPVASDEPLERLRLGESFSFWANGLLSIGIGKNSDLLVMKIAGATSHATGIYNAAFNANATVVQAPLQGIGTMLYVRLGNAFASGSRERTAAAWETAALIGNMATLPFISFAVFFPTSILTLLYGSSFDNAATPFVLLMTLGAAGRVLGGGCGQALLFLARRQSVVLRVRCLCVALNMVADYVGYKLIGIEGVALASGVSGLLITAIELWYARDIAPFKIRIAPLLRLTAPYLGLSLVLRLIVDGHGHRFFDLIYLTVVMVVGTMLLFFTRPLRGTETPSTGPIWVRRVVEWLS